MAKQVTPCLPSRLKTCLKCFKDQVIEAGYTEERAFIVDAIDYLIEATDREKRCSDDK